jgi:hypothetical protein
MRYVKVIDGEEIELTPEEVAEFLAQVPQEPEPQAYRLFKSTFIRRLVKDEEKDEAAIMEGVLAQADAQLRLLFNSVEYFVSDDPLFTTLKVAVGAALGDPRADELLAPEA